VQLGGPNITNKYSIDKYFTTKGAIFKCFSSFCCVSDGLHQWIFFWKKNKGDWLWLVHFQREPVSLAEKGTLSPKKIHWFTASYWWCSNRSIKLTVTWLYSIRVLTLVHFRPSIWVCMLGLKQSYYNIIHGIHHVHSCHKIIKKRLIIMHKFSVNMHDNQLMITNPINSGRSRVLATRKTKYIEYWSKILLATISSGGRGGNWPSKNHKAQPSQAEVLELRKECLIVY
jgi:hypothetical protein